MNIRSRIDTIRMVMQEKSYVVLFFIFLIIYIAVNFLINQFQEVIPFFLSYNLYFVIPYFTLTILIAITIALNLTIISYKLKKVCGSSGGSKSEKRVTFLGAIGGLLGGACPGCFDGLLPTVAGVFGITITLSSLPFLGVEIQIPTLLLLLGGLYLVANPLTCKIDQPKGAE